MEFQFQVFAFPFLHLLFGALALKVYVFVVGWRLFGVGGLLCCLDEAVPS